MVAVAFLILAPACSVDVSSVGPPGAGAGDGGGAVDERWEGEGHFAIQPGPAIAVGGGLTLQPMTALDQWERRAVVVAAHAATGAARARLDGFGVRGFCGGSAPVQLYVTSEATLPPAVSGVEVDGVVSVFRGFPSALRADVIVVAGPSVGALYRRVLDEIAGYWYHRGCGAGVLAEDVRVFSDAVTAAVRSAPMPAADIERLAGGAQPAAAGPTVGIHLAPDSAASPSAPTRRDRRRARRSPAECTTRACGR
jgi:hypothetical protein